MAEIDRLLKRANGEVALPEAGKGAFIKFDVEALEMLEGFFSDDYIDTIITDMRKVKVVSYRKLAAATVKNGDGEKNVPYGLTWDVLNTAFLDALHLALHGRTFDEHKEFVEKEMLEQMKKRTAGMEENPQLAAALSLMASTKQESEQG